MNYVKKFMEDNYLKINEKFKIEGVHLNGQSYSYNAEYYFNNYYSLMSEGEQMHEIQLALLDGSIYVRNNKNSGTISVGTIQGIPINCMGGIIPSKLNMHYCNDERELIMPLI